MIGANERKQWWAMFGACAAEALIATIVVQLATDTWWGAVAAVVPGLLFAWWLLDRQRVLILPEDRELARAAVLRAEADELRDALANAVADRVRREAGLVREDPVARLESDVAELRRRLAEERARSPIPAQLPSRGPSQAARC